MSGKDLLAVDLTGEEVRYLVSCGIALVQNVPEHMLVVYCGFTKQQIVDFSSRMRGELDKAGLDM